MSRYTRHRDQDTRGIWGWRVDSPTHKDIAWFPEGEDPTGAELHSLFFVSLANARQPEAWVEWVKGGKV